MGIKSIIACLLVLSSIDNICLAQTDTTNSRGVYKTGFVPAAETIFSDDFAKYRNGFFISAKRDNNTGAKIATDSAGNNVLLFSGEMRTLIPVISDKYAPGKYVTFECDFMLPNDKRATLILDFPDSDGNIHYFTIDNNWLVQYVRGNNTSGGDYTIPIKNRYFGPTQWHCLAIAFSERSLQVYLDNYQIWGLGNTYQEWEHDTTVVDDAFLYNGYKPASFIISNKTAIALKSVRLAKSENLPTGYKIQVAAFNKILTGAKFATQDIYFDVNRATIKDESLAYLAALATWLKQNPTTKLQIAGHTDSDGDEAANRLLSQMRAEEIVKKLISFGLAATRLSSVGYGETMPVKSNSTAAGKAANRRVEFRKI